MGKNGAVALINSYRYKYTIIIKCLELVRQKETGIMLTIK